MANAPYTGSLSPKKTNEFVQSVSRSHIEEKAKLVLCRAVASSRGEVGTVALPPAESSGMWGKGVQERATRSVRCWSSPAFSRWPVRCKALALFATCV